MSNNDRECKPKIYTLNTKIEGLLAKKDSRNTRNVIRVYVQYTEIYFECLVLNICMYLVCNFIHYHILNKNSLLVVQALIFLV